MPVKKLTKDQLYNVFIRWFGMPETVRDPGTIVGFCEKMGTTQAMLAEFQASEYFTDDLVREARKWGKQKYPELLGLLYTRCLSSKNPNDFKIFKDLLTADKEDAKKNEDDGSRTGLLKELYDNSLS